MAFHGTTSLLQGTPWHSMEHHDIPWNFITFHGTPSLLHGTPWNSMAFHGTPWILYGIPWYSMGVSWNSMDFHRFPWNSMDFHRFPWISMDFHGVPWRYFTRAGIVLEISSYFPSEQNKNFGYFLHRLDLFLYQTFHECEFSIAISISAT